MKRSIGFRCNASGFAYVVLSGTVSAPTLLASDATAAPKGASRPATLQWVRKEVQEILDTWHPEVGYYRATEGNARSPSQERAQVEGVLIEAAASHDPEHLLLDSRVRSQIRRDTKFSGKPKELEDLLEVDGLAGLSRAKCGEACLAALCGLPVE